MYLRSTVSVTHVSTLIRPKGTWSLPTSVLRPDLKELGPYPRQDAYLKEPGPCPRQDSDPT